MGTSVFDETVQVSTPEKLKIAIITSRFNNEITQELTARCNAQLQKCGIAEQHIEKFNVPGALEIPFVAAKLIHEAKYDALIAIGCVIRGETYHFELVANESAFGLSKLNLKGKIPIINAILTVENSEQAVARLSKGQEAALAALEMIHFVETCKQ